MVPHIISDFDTNYCNNIIMFHAVNRTSEYTQVAKDKSSTVNHILVDTAK